MEKSFISKLIPILSPLALFVLESVKSYYLVSRIKDKNVFVFNEEILVVFCFLAFVFFVYHSYGNTIKDSLEERGTTIKTEFQYLGMGKQELLVQLYKEHKLLSIGNQTGLQSKPSTIGDLPDSYETSSGINSLVSNLVKITSKKMAIAQRRRTIVINNIFNHQKREKLKTLISKTIVQQKLQQLMADNLSGLANLYFQATITNIGSTSIEAFKRF